MRSTSSSSSSSLSQQDVQLHQQLIAASFGGAVSAIVTCPFDVIKTRLQVAPTIPVKNARFKQQVFSGTMDAFIKITKNEGVLTLWRGLAPSLIMTVPNAAIYFNSYEGLKKQIARLDLVSAGLIPLIAGAIARVIAVTTLAPLELIRTNFQASNPSSSNRNQTVLSFVKKTGAKGLWLGVGATLTRDVPFSAIYWSCYEFLKARLKNEIPQHKSGAFITSFVCGCMSGMLSAFLTTPIDLVKTRLQTRTHDPNHDFAKKLASKMAKAGGRPHGMVTSSSVAATSSAAQKVTAREIARIIYREEGVKGFMKGWLPRAAKVGPACAIMISSYEFIKSIGTTNECARG